MPKLFLHIGPHKTGSTYIQKFCSENRAKLLNLGVNYPTVGIGGVHYGQHEIIEKVKKLRQEELKHYLAQLTSGAINLVSSENFDRLNLEEVKRLRAALSGVDVRIIYYYRNYIDLLPSWWQEEVKHGSTTSFYEFVLPHILRPFSSIIVNPAVVLDLYATAFGKDNISIVDYELAVKAGNILQPILALLGVELEGVKNEIVNASLKIEIVEVIRALNMKARANNQWHLHRTRALFLRKGMADAISKDTEHLLGVIRAHVKPLKLAGGYFEQSVNASFREKYESCWFKAFLGESPEREILIPSDKWMLDGGCFPSM